MVCLVASEPNTSPSGQTWERGREGQLLNRVAGEKDNLPIKDNLAGWKTMGPKHALFGGSTISSNSLVKGGNSKSNHVVKGTILTGHPGSFWAVPVCVQR